MDYRSINRRGSLPLADDDVALTVNHVVDIDAGELVNHVHYHILSSIDLWLVYHKNYGKARDIFWQILGAD